jgi:hypothetical protein
MPSMMSMFKNYEINSEEDIPAEYRAEIEEKLSNEPEELQLVASEQTLGERGLVVSTTEDIRKEFSDESVYYFGHGTSGNETVLTSILETGLRAVNPKAIRAYGNTLRGLDSTTLVFGSGTDKLFEDIKNSYIQAYAEVSNVNPRETSKSLPLNEQEMEVICKEWYKEQLRKLRTDRTFDEQDLNDTLHKLKLVAQHAKATHKNKGIKNNTLVSYYRTKQLRLLFSVFNY